jgi:hypothetical protein
MNEAPVWNCQFAPRSGEGAEALDALTVGSRFAWKCHGDIGVAWDQKPFRLVFAKNEDQYTLSILKVLRQDPNDVEFEVTAYKPGEHKPDYVRVLQGQGAEEKGFETAHPTWVVHSVLDPKQPPQPYGPFGPWSLHLPLWFIMIVALVAALIVGAVVRFVRKSTQRRRMLEELQRHKTVLPPLHQFYRDTRQLRRRLHNVKEPTELKQIGVDLDRDFRLYVLRRFQIPALEWSNGDILKDLRRRHRKTYLETHEPLKRTLRELMKMKERPQLAANDVEQMQRMSLETAEKLDAAMSAGGRA